MCVQDAGVSVHSMVGGGGGATQSCSALISSSPAVLPAVPSVSLLQPGMLTASLMPGLRLLHCYLYCLFYNHFISRLKITIG